MDGSATTIQQTVSPGQSADISVDLTAPDEVGGYTGYWMLEDNNGAAFGEQVYVQIAVTDDAATSTATPTDAYTASPTATPAATGTLEAPPTREDNRHRPTRTPTATAGASATPTSGSEAP